MDSPVPQLRSRPSFRSRRALFAGAGLLLLGALWWYNEHRVISWAETVNPMYWVRRFRNEDLYDAEHHLLMRGNRARNEVALTFDDGPHLESRAKILDLLKQYQAKATFFDVGTRMAEAPDLLRRTLEEGHEIANHSTNHNRLTELSGLKRHREINDADIAFYRLTGKHLALLRPPGMQYNASVLAETQRLGYTVVGYTTASRDFEPDEAPEKIAQRTLRRTETGSIILLHDYAPTAAALPTILKTLSARGYRFVTISEMLDHLPEPSRTSALSWLAQADIPVLKSENKNRARRELSSEKRP